MSKKGLIYVYTGDGKGKTTAAVGQAVRARGHNLKVCYVCFHKDPKRWKCGERGMLKKIGVDVIGFAEGHPHFCKNLKAGEIRKECLAALEFIKMAYQKKRYDMLILDEINISLRDGFLNEKEVMDIVRAKPKKLELILTGRGASKKIIEKADLVSRIEKVKHPYDLGIQRKKGVEY